MNVERFNRVYHGHIISRYPWVDVPSLTMTAAWVERGLKLREPNGRQQFSTSQAQATSRSGRRESTSTSFIRPIRYYRHNLRVRTQAHAMYLDIDDRTVSYTYKGHLQIARARREIILSAGTINTPQLLMLSGVGPRKHLQHLRIPLIKDLPVGENLQDHVTFNGIVIALPNQTSTSISREGVIRSLYEYKRMRNKQGPLSGNGPISTISFIKSEPNLPAPDIQIQVDSVMSEEFIPQPQVYDTITIFPTCFYNALVPRTMNLVPKSRGRLLLNATNPHGPPLIYANYFSDPTDLIPIIKGVKILLSLESTKALKSIGAHFVKTPLPACTHYFWGTDEYIECLARAYTSTPYHPVGTCKMGPGWDKTAVVDSRLRVHGVPGVRVVDASIMPVVPRGNTNAPSIMVGERRAAFIIEDWFNKDHLY